MAMTFFKTEQKYRDYLKEKEAEGFEVNTRNSVQCACGESAGARILDDNLDVVEKVCLCEACYKESWHKGE